MKITKVEDFHVDGGWDVWCFLKITTDEGLVGWSEFSEERARSGLTLVVRHMARSLIGLDPRAVGVIGATLYGTTRGATGGLLSLAIGAIENACLDIKAKALGVPVYELFGGALRKRLPLYWSHCAMYRARYPKIFSEVIGQEPIRTLDDVKQAGRLVAASGYKALKTNLLLLDPQRLGGRTPIIARGSGPFELNIETSLVRDAVSQLEALADGCGPGVDLMMDLNFNFKTEGFKRMAQAVEPLDLRWLEMDTNDSVGLASIRRGTTTPIASLETLLGRRALAPFVEQRAVDVGIIDVGFNGMSESVRMASFLDTYEINAAAHNTYSVLGSLIAAHFCAVIPNFRVLEFDVDEVPWRRALATNPLRIENGELVLGDAPGWGTDINEDVAREHAVSLADPA